MNQIARMDATEMQEAPQAAAPPTSMMEVIARAVSDPNLDVEKLERLTGLYERLSAREAETAFNDAMSAAQEEMRPIAADANNPQTHSKYASYAALDRVLRPIYTKHGFAVSFGTAEGAPQDHIRVTVKVTHRAGHCERTHVDMPADGKGAKGGDVMTKTHAAGAAMTYAQRYLLKMVFNIAIGEDRDGNAPREIGGSAQKAISEINACEDLAALKKWKAERFAGVSNIVTDHERNEIIALCNRRAAELKPKA